VRSEPVSEAAEGLIRLRFLCRTQRSLWPSAALAPLR
jgi:hypothetical protein